MGWCVVLLSLFRGKAGPKNRPADTDIDDVANAFASVAFPRATPHAVGKVSHLVEYVMDLRNNVLAIDNDGSPFQRAECHMKNGTVFRYVDLVAPEHGVDPLTQPRLICELHE